MTIKDYIELKQTIFGLDESTTDKIKTKISRILEKNQEWIKIKDKKTKKNKGAILTETLIKDLDKKLQKYLLKISKIEKSDFERQKAINENISLNINSDFEIITEKVYEFKKEDQYKYSITQKEKINLMIEALFFEKFELDEEKWIEDNSTKNLFIDDEEAVKSEEVILAMTRLNNPIKYYVKKKK